MSIIYFVTVFTFLLCFSLIEIKCEQMNGRKPACPQISLFGACPFILLPVCGTDGITYNNECLLCIARHETKKNILIQKYGSC
ncbi:trypsin inhibitor ClTI-1-like [Protopterus annectens]|uniref:trypsin inhibitor ClTI-1-like n=1 Tax=Protopterus annectens TaxID=7888 RepID=UPI001CF9B795|nr:trypsin inhibitor ClTI-1-like [Protopterus annectens]